MIKSGNQLVELKMVQLKLSATPLIFPIFLNICQINHCLNVLIQALLYTDTKNTSCRRKKDFIEKNCSTSF